MSMALPWTHQLHGFLLSPGLRVLRYRLGRPVGQAKVYSSHHHLLHCTSVPLRPVQPPVLGLPSHESRPDARTTDPGTAVDACILEKQQKGCCGLWTGTEVKPLAAAALGRLAGASRPGCPTTELSQGTSMPSDGFSSFKSWGLCSNCAGEDGSQAGVKASWRICHPNP